MEQIDVSEFKAIWSSPWTPMSGKASEVKASVNNHV
jgi:hypothetical protein